MTKDELILDDCLKALEYMANRESPIVYTCDVCTAKIHEGDVYQRFDDKITCSSGICQGLAALGKQQGEALDFVLQEEYIGDFALYVGLDKALKEGLQISIEDLLVKAKGFYAPTEFIKSSYLAEFLHFYKRKNKMCGGLQAQKEEL